MYECKAHAATDVTGFGILGHAANLASNQKDKVKFVIHTLPILRGMAKVSKQHEYFKLLQGYSAETSGGLLVCLSKANAQRFIERIQQVEGQPAWIIGDVVSSTDEARSAALVSNPTILEV